MSHRKFPKHFPKFRILIVGLGLVSVFFGCDVPETDLVEPPADTLASFESDSISTEERMCLLDDDIPREGVSIMDVFSVPDVFKPCRICPLPPGCTPDTCMADICCTGFHCCSEKAPPSEPPKPNSKEELKELLDYTAQVEGPEAVVKVFQQRGFKRIEISHSIDDRAAPLECWQLEPAEGQMTCMRCCDERQDGWSCNSEPCIDNK